MSNFEMKKSKMAMVVLLGISALCANAASRADSAIDLGTVQSGSGTGSAQQDKQKSAAYQAPTKASLKATQPQSIIGQQYIEHNAAPTANYTDIVSVAPSVSDIAPNGPGGMESQGLSMRGFQDGQYNVTFDDIPFADSNDFTHHSTSYFMPQDTGSIVVDRGPGSASTIGDATFGGTIAVASREPEEIAALTPYVSFGSHASRLFGLRYDTGAIKSLNDTRAYVVPDFGFSVVGQYFPKDYEHKMIEDMQRRLREFVNAHVPEDIPAHDIIGHGPIYSEILEAAESIGADLIVLASHRPGLQDYLIGPNASKVVRHAKCSVLVIRE